MRRQTRLKSLAESVFDIFVGFIIYLPINYFVLPVFAEGIEQRELFTMLQISALYTIIALVRKYAIRRWFIGFRLVQQ